MISRSSHELSTVCASRRRDRLMTTTLQRMAIVCASLLAVACASSEETTATTRETPALAQDQPYEGDGTPQIETEQEAKDVALWFLRGRGFWHEGREAEIIVIEREDSWFVGVDEPGEVHPVGSGVFLDIARSGQWMRVSFGR